jgi:hypothetical protein
MSRLQDIQNRQVPSYITPLFWQHGESESVLREEIRQMHQNGIGSFILESRPHPDFMGARWWHDLDVILDEAKQYGMKVWIFDDKTYPSGFGAGLIADSHPELLKIYLADAGQLVHREGLARGRRTPGRAGGRPAQRQSRRAGW